MVKTENSFEFIDIVRNIIDTVTVNLTDFNNTFVKLNSELIKTIYLFVTPDFIKKNMVTDTLTYEIICSNLEREDIVNMFKPYFYKLHEDKIKREFSELSEDELEKLKNKYPEYFTLDENLIVLKINIRDKKNKNSNKSKSSSKFR